MCENKCETHRVLARAMCENGGKGPKLKPLIDADGESPGGFGPKLTEIGMIFSLHSGPIYSDLLRFSPI